MVSTANLCIMCKGGRSLCGNEPCPLLARQRIVPELKKKVSKDFFGPSASVFVGRAGYPNIHVGPTASMDESKASLMDKPGEWFGMEYESIMEMASINVRSRLKQNVFSRSGFIEDNQLLAMASKPADVEINFKKVPVYKLSFSDIHQPMGPSAPLEKLRIVENVRVSRVVEKIVSDELRAVDASFELYSRQEDVYRITSILSSGALGDDKKKKLVPTRWSITAVDDMIANRLRDEVKRFESISEYLVYESSYLDNHFIVLFMPGKWEFENFEVWAPGSTWHNGAAMSILNPSLRHKMLEPIIIGEYEGFEGRTKYADLQSGGYYASRLGILEALHDMRRQARVVVFREVSEGYVVPLGVWVVRETVRSAFRKKPFRFETMQKSLDYINSKLKLPIEKYIKTSRVLRQKRLDDF